MTWLAWRQSRMEIMVTLAILAALAAFLLLTGLEKYGAFEDSGLQACLDAGTADCSDLRNRFVDSYNSVNSIVGWFHFAPAIVGVLLALPTVSEIDQRTYRLAWTQSITRARWFASKLGIALVGAAIFSVALALLMAWWHAPLDRAELRFGHFGQSFAFTGVMPFAYTVFALSLAMAAGAVSRRTVVAMPVALVGFVALRLPLEFLLRPGYTGPADGPASVGGSFGSANYWMFQTIEGTIFLGIAAALFAVTAWVVTRRMSLGLLNSR